LDENVPDLIGPVFNAARYDRKDNKKDLSSGAPKMRSIIAMGNTLGELSKLNEIPEEPSSTMR